MDPSLCILIGWNHEATHILLLNGSGTWPNLHTWIIQISWNVGSFSTKKGQQKQQQSRFSTSQGFFLGFHRFHRFPEVGSMSFSISPGSTADFRPTSIPGGLPSAVPRRRAALGAAGRRRWIPRRCGVDVGGSLGVAGGSAKTWLGLEPWRWWQQNRS